MLEPDDGLLKTDSEGYVEPYLTEGSISGFSAQQLNQPSPEDVVNALRLGEGPESTYHLLKQFAIMNRHCPMVSTDRGRVLFVDYTPQSGKLLLYVGSQEEFVKLCEEPGNELYVLAVDERYDFVPSLVSGVITRVRQDRTSLSLRSAKADVVNGKFIPVLYISASSQPTTIAQCTLRVEFIPQSKDEVQQPEPKPIEPLLGYFNVSSAKAKPIPGSSKLRYAADPTANLTSDREAV